MVTLVLCNLIYFKIENIFVLLLIRSFFKLCGHCCTESQEYSIEFFQHFTVVFTVGTEDPSSFGKKVQVCLSCGFPSRVVSFLCSTILEESTASVLRVTGLVQACAKVDRSLSVM